MAVEDELAASNELLQNQASYNKLLEETNRLRMAEVGDLSKEVNFLKSIGAYGQAEAVHAKNMVEQQKAANKLAEKYLDIFGKTNKLQKEDVDLIKKAAFEESRRCSSRAAAKN